MPVVRWKFTDPVASTSYTFEINPIEGGSPDYTKNIGSEGTLAPGGNVLVYEGQRPVLTLEFTGTILTKEHYVAFLMWWRKAYPIQIEDDLGRSAEVVFTSFQPKRVRSPSRPYKHTYSAKCTVLSMTDLDEI